MTGSSVAALDRRRLNGFLVGLALGLAGVAWTSAQEVPRPPISPAGPASFGGKILLLRNGNLLHGQVLPAGDRYLVGTPRGGQISVPAADVEAVYESVAEVYQTKKGKVAPRDATARLSLAEWCLRQGLAAQAADELLVAFTLDPGNRRLAALEQRLLLESNRGPAPTAEPVGASGDHRPAPTQVTSPTSPPPLPVAVAEFDEPLAELPPAALERFVNSIQPVLTNRCAGVACHSVTSQNSFRLIRPKLGEILSARHTRRNLNEVLRLTDRRQPESSKLLQVPLQPHGNAPELLAIGDRNYQNLLDWLRQIDSGRGETAKIETAGRPRWVDGRVLPAAFLEELTNDSRTNSAPDTTRGAPRGRGDHQDRPPSAARPPDPLDPEIFNSRYLKPPEELDSLEDAKRPEASK